MVNPALDYEKARPVIAEALRRAHAHQLVSIEAVIDRLNSCIKPPPVHTNDPSENINDRPDTTREA